VIGKLIKKAGGPALYGLRHAYAIRAWRLGIDLELAARLMGNSALLQEKIYRRWLEQDQLEQMVRAKLAA
jgi:site-specific recombinase XerD